MGFKRIKLMKFSKIARRGSLLAALSLLLAACGETNLQAFGQLQSERVELVAESAEPIIVISVAEGDTIEPGDVLMAQDATRVEAKLLSMQAEIDRVTALLDEQTAGTRAETIAVAKARLDAAKVELTLGEKALKRLEELKSKDLTSTESVDIATRNLAASRAQVALADAQLKELEAGVRQQQITQTRALLSSLEAQFALLEIDQSRLQIRSPSSARVDALPYEVGERPRSGDVVAVLLIGAQPLARVYIPEIVRAQIDMGTRLDVTIDGIDEVVSGRVLRIEAEASFTPYFALSEQDRGRLSYIAELDLNYAGPRLPEGLPVQIDLGKFAVDAEQ